MLQAGRNNNNARQLIHWEQLAKRRQKVAFQWRLHRGCRLRASCPRRMSVLKRAKSPAFKGWCTRATHAFGFPCLLVKVCSQVCTREWQATCLCLVSAANKDLKSPKALSYRNCLRGRRQGVMYETCTLGLR